MATDNGGAAFPRPVGQTTSEFGSITQSFEQEGMTLLDWFAGKALEGMLANDELFLASLQAAKKVDKDPSEFRASACYDLATAMVAEKRRREQS
jgi:hypothetical protein